MNEQQTNAAEAGVTEAEASHDAGRVTKRSLQGVVVSDKNDKTITVLVTRRLQHPLYKKYIKKSKKYHAHDENNTAREGDEVRIVESRPRSRLKRWDLVKVVKKAV